MLRLRVRWINNQATRVMAELAFDSDVEIRRITLTGLLMRLVELLPASRDILQASMEKLDKGDADPELFLMDAILAINKPRTSDRKTRDLLLCIRDGPKTPINIRLTIDAKLNQPDNILRKFINFIISTPSLLGG